MTETEESALVRQTYAEALRRDPQERIDYVDRACAANIDIASPAPTDSRLSTVPDNFVAIQLTC